MKRCMGCMELYEDQYDVCPHCGYEEGYDDHQLLHIDAGQLLADRYIVGKSLGFGGFGVTYLGWDTKLNRKVAIKEYLPSEFATRMVHHQEIMVDSNEKKNAQFNSGMTRFLKEGEKLAQVGDVDGIVHMYDCFEANNTAYITMEYLKGMTLTQYLDDKGIMSEAEVMELMLPIFKSLEAVHEKGIIHRDIAPDNLFVTIDDEGNERLKLIDFGASKFASSSHSKSLTVMIKPGYSPEEQYRSNGDQGTYTDVYALSAVMYRMVTGVQPPDSFERRTAIESHKKDPLVAPGKINKNLSANFETALLNALNVRIEDRTSNISNFENELVSFDPVKRRGSSIRRIDYMRWPLWAKIGVPMASLAAVSLLVFAITKVFSGVAVKYSLPDGYTRVPQFVEADFDTDAQKYASNAKVIIEKSDARNSAKYPRNLVVEQPIPSGTIVSENTVIGLTISSGEEVFVMPDVRGMRLEDARKAIEVMGGEVNLVTDSQEGLVLEGVIAQDIDAFGEFKYGSTVTLTFNSVKSASLNTALGSSVNKEDYDASGVFGEDDNTQDAPIEAIRTSSKAPDVTGLTYEEALKKVSEAGWSLFVSGRRVSKDKPAGTVLDAKISDYADDVNVLDITVAMPELEFEIPNLELKSKEDAIQLLKNMGIEVEVKEEPHEMVAAGKICTQSVTGQTTVKSGEKVTITVSSGGKPFEMPKLTKMTQEEAEKAGREKNLVIEVEYDFDPSIPVGSVISQSVDDGVKVKRGQSVMIVICSDESIVSVPGLASMTVDEARTILTNSNLNVQINEIESTEPKGRVLSQIPDEGSRQKEGVTVVITVSKGGLAVVPNVVGQSYSAAAGSLESTGFKVNKSESYSNSVPQGNVFAQSISAGSTEKTGTSVTLTVSLGKEPTKIADNNLGDNSSDESSKERSWHLSDWGSNPPDGAEIVGTKTEYRARNRKTTTSDQASLTGWTQTGSTFSYSDWGSWSQSDSDPGSNDEREVSSIYEERRRNKETTTSNEQLSSPWNLEGTPIDVGYWGNVIDNGKVAVTATSTRKVSTYEGHEQVQIGTEYEYYCVFGYVDGVVRVSGTSADWVSNTLAQNGLPTNDIRVETKWELDPNIGPHAGNGNLYDDWSPTGANRPVYGDSTYTGYKYQDWVEKWQYTYWKWSEWSDWTACSSLGTNTESQEYKTTYQYRTRTKIWNYTYEQWTDWSGYSDTASGDDVQSRTVYQWKIYD